MTVYYWEDRPRAEFKVATESLRHESRVGELRLTIEGEVAVEGVFTLAQLEVIVKALRKYEQEVAEAKAYVAAPPRGYPEA